MIIAALIYVFELVKLPQVFGKFFDSFGKNPLFIFVLSGALPRLLGLIRIPNGTTGKFLSPFSWFYEHVCKNIFVDLNPDIYSNSFFGRIYESLCKINGNDYRLGSFVYAIIMIIFYWLIAYIMDRKKIYVKV